MDHALLLLQDVRCRCPQCRCSQQPKGTTIMGSSRGTAAPPGGCGR